MIDRAEARADDEQDRGVEHARQVGVRHGGCERNEHAARAFDQENVDVCGARGERAHEGRDVDRRADAFRREHRRKRVGEAIGADGVERLDRCRVVVDARRRGPRDGRRDR